MEKVFVVRFDSFLDGESETTFDVCSTLEVAKQRFHDILNKENILEPFKGRILDKKGNLITETDDEEFSIEYDKDKVFYEIEKNYYDEWLNVLIYEEKVL